MAAAPKERQRLDQILTAKAAQKSAPRTILVQMTSADAEDLLFLCRKFLEGGYGALSKTTFCEEVANGAGFSTPVTLSNIETVLRFIKQGRL